MENRGSRQHSKDGRNFDKVGHLKRWNDAVRGSSSEDRDLSEELREIAPNVRLHTPKPKLGGHA